MVSSDGRDGDERKPMPIDLEQLLNDLSGLERLQALQMSLVQQLRVQVETAVRRPDTGPGTGSRVGRH